MGCFGTLNCLCGLFGKFKICFVVGLGQVKFPVFVVKQIQILSFLLWGKINSLCGSLGKFKFSLFGCGASSNSLCVCCFGKLKLSVFVVLASFQILSCVLFGKIELSVFVFGKFSNSLCVFGKIKLSVFVVCLCVVWQVSNSLCVCCLAS